MKHGKYPLILACWILLAVPLASAQTATYTPPDSYFNSQGGSTSSAATDTSGVLSSAKAKKGSWTSRKASSRSGLHGANRSKSGSSSSVAPGEETAPVAVTADSAPAESAPAPAADTSVAASAPAPDPTPDPNYSVPAASEPAPAEAAGSADLAGYDGGFFLKDRAGKFSMTINGRFQPRYAVNIAEDIDDKHSFVLRRAFFLFSGHVIDERLTYEALVLLNGLPPLAYLALNWKFMDEFTLGVGLDAPPLSHSGAESSGKKLIPDASLPDVKFNIGDSIGMWAFGAIGKVYYATGVFNSMDAGLSRNANAELAYGMKWGWNILGEYGSGESDLANSPDPNLFIEAGATLHHEESGTQAKVYHGASSIGLKWSGFSFFTEGFARYIDPDEFTREQIDLGYIVQFGAFAIPGKLEFGIRHAALLDDINDVGINQNMTSGNIGGLDGPHIAVDVNGDSDNEYEYSASVNYYFAGNNAKLQLQYSFIMDGIPGADDASYHVGFLQGQVGF